MRPLHSTILAALAALALLAASAAPARAVAVSSGSGSGMAGQTVDIDINTADLTGLGVVSFQFSLGYNNTIVTATDVITTGSMVAAAGWSAPQFHVTNSGSAGTISVSAAGTSALSGAGSLLKVRFVIMPSQLGGNYAYLTLPSFTFNEGAPPATPSGSYLTVVATPQIDVTPEQGEIVRGSTLGFSVSGSPTAPIAWMTSNSNIATISSAGLLTGVAPGAVTVTATDAASHSATTSGQVLVRGMGLTAGTATVVAGQPVTLPITVTTLAGLGIRSGQFTLSFSPTIVATGVTTPSGTLLNGWGATSFDQGPGSASVAFAGPTDLTGSGTLCNVTFSTANPTSVGIGVASALFNENLPALRTSGLVTVNALPTIAVSPDQVTLLAGQTQQFSLTGSYTNPIAWSVEDPSIASITSAGLVTALQGGVTRVRAQDAVGAVDYNTALTVYDLKATLSSATGPPGRTVKLVLASDRLVGGLAIHSLQFSAGWAGAYVVGGRATPSGLWNAWYPGGIVSHFTPNALIVASGGASVLGGTGPELGSIELDIAPGAPLGTDIPVNVNNLVLNEGHPVAQSVGGVVHVRATTELDGPAAAAFALGRSEPNPARGGARIPFALPDAPGAASRASLAVYALDGRRVRTLIDSPLEPGPHEAWWDGRDDAGQPVRAGLYFTRLLWRGQSATRKLARVE
jgi:hypothetical protein